MGNFACYVHAGVGKMYGGIITYEKDGLVMKICTSNNLQVLRRSFAAKISQSFPQGKILRKLFAKLLQLFIMYAQEIQSVYKLNRTSLFIVEYGSHFFDVIKFKVSSARIKKCKCSGFFRKFHWCRPIRTKGSRAVPCGTSNFREKWQGAVRARQINQINKQ
jgi:hypothetical protein